MERPSLRHFSLPAPGSLCIFIYGLRPAVPLRPTGPTGPILHPAMCLLMREDSLNPNRVKNNNLRVSKHCNFGHRMEPSRPSSEASRESRSHCKYPNASIVPCTTQRFVASHRLLCFELDTDGSFRWSTQPHFPCFCQVSFTYPSHVPCNKVNLTISIFLHALSGTAS